MTVHLARCLIAISLLTPSLAAATVLCEDENIRVHGANSDEAEAVCEVSIRAKAVLAECGIVQTTPVDIQIARHLSGDLGRAFLGACRPEEGRVELLDRSDFRSHLNDDGPISAIPPEELYDSFIVHELTHALYFQTTSSQPQCRAANEYIASSMQITFLTEESRNDFLADFQPLRDGSLDRFNEFVLAMDPLAFSMNAYLHFIRPENGCSFIRRVISGEVTFPDENRSGGWGRVD